MNHALVDALDLLGEWLTHQEYGFTTPTPSTIARVNARYNNVNANNLREVFGWSRSFAPDFLPAELLGCLRDGELLEVVGEGFRSRVRFSTIGRSLYAHSAFPTTEPDSIFFGPDSYRFIDLIRNELAIAPLIPEARILDICCGAGPGGIEAGLVASSQTAVITFSDINPVALDFARSNARRAGVLNARFVQSDLFRAVPEQYELVIANPPYLVDATNRIYRNGGGALGAELSERLVAEGTDHLVPGGKLILYSGVAIVDGVDPFHNYICSTLDRSKFSYRYRELDPDVFGEELDTPAYQHAERIAAVALVIEHTSP